MPFIWKVATEAWEFEQVHALNYATFVEEIPQHAPRPSRLLVDRFHAENTYLVCLNADRVVGMLALRGQRPFSLDAKLADLDSYLPPGRSPCEVRLLSVHRSLRQGAIFWGLIRLLPEFFREHGYDLAVLSGALSQRELYANLGCVPFGPVVGTAEAPYQPMYLAIEDFERRVQRLARKSRDPSSL